MWYCNGDAAVAVIAVLGLVVNGFSLGQGVLLEEVPKQEGRRDLFFLPATKEFQMVLYGTDF